MKSLSRLVIAAMAACQPLWFGSCTQDAYEKGEGRYSLMRGDFAEVQVDGTVQAVSIVTDEGETLPLSEPYTAKWITRSDTLYRCMLYYNKVETHGGHPTAEVLSLAQVQCPVVTPLWQFEEPLRTDPVGLESFWMSKSGKYVNMGLQLKTGVTEDTAAVHQLAVLSDTLMANRDGTATRCLFLHHDQSGVPEHFTTKVYLSLPVPGLAADSVRLTVNTYDGYVVRTLPLHK